MKRVGQATKNAFTIIEVSLYLALTGLIFVGIIATTRGNLARQRYLSSVNGTVNHLQSIYEELEHPSNTDDAPDCYGTYSMNDSSLYKTRLSAKNATLSMPQLASGRRIGSGCSIYGEMINFLSSDDGTTIQHIPIVGTDLNDTQKKKISTYGLYTQLVFVAADTIINPDGNKLTSSGTYANNETGFLLSGDLASYDVDNQSQVKLVVRNFQNGVQQGGNDVYESDFSIVILRNPSNGDITTDIIRSKNQLVGVATMPSKSFDDFNEYSNTSTMDNANIGFSYYYYLKSDSDNAGNYGRIHSISQREHGTYTYKTYLCVYPGAGSDAKPVRAIRVDRDAASSSAINLMDVSESKGICD